MPFTYLGILDDKVQQYPWKFEPTIDVINTQIITYVLYGQPLLINDGSLIANPVVHESLVDGPESIIGSMMEEGFIKLYTRSQERDILTGIREAASSGVEDHRQFLKDERWNREVLPYLEDVLPRIAPLAEVWPAPRTFNVGKAFYDHLAGLYGASRQVMNLDFDPALFRMAFDEFDRCVDKASFSAARTRWEKVAIPGLRTKLKDDSAFPTVARGLMNLANEAYHIAQASGFRATRDPAEPVHVQTGFSSAFENRLEREEDVSTDVAARLAALQPYLIKMPRRIRVSGSGLRHFTRTRQGIGRLKMDYLAGIDGFMKGTTGEREMADLANDYSKALSDHLGRYEHVSAWKREAAGWVVATALNAVPIIGTVLSTAFSLSSSTVFRWYRQRSLWTEMNEGRVDALQGDPAKLLDTEPWRRSMMSLALRPETATARTPG